MKALQETAEGDLEFEVLTTMPNRYHSYDSQASTFEQMGNVTIRRFEIKSHKSGFLDQSLCFASFARQVLTHTWGDRKSVV